MKPTTTQLLLIAAFAVIGTSLLVLTFAGSPHSLYDLGEGTAGENITIKQDEDTNNGYIEFNNTLPQQQIGASTNGLPIDFREAVPSGLLRTVNVSTSGELKNALSAAKPGDEIIMASGNYGSNISLDGVQGNATNPIVLRPETGGNVVVTAASTDRGAGIVALKNASYLFVGTPKGDTATMKIDANGKGNGISVGTTDVFNTVHHITFSGVELYKSRYSLVHVKSESHHISFVGGSYHSSGFNNATELGFAESFYIGSSSNSMAKWGRNDPVHHITIRGNNIYKGVSDGVDLKTGSGIHDIVIEHNWFHDFALSGQHSAVGVITTGSGDTSNYNPNANITVDSNKIWNVTEDKSQGDKAVPNGITVYSPARVVNNLIWNIENDGIAVWDNIPAGRKNQKYSIIHNTVWNTNNKDFNLTSTKSDTAAFLETINNLGSVAYSLGEKSGNLSSQASDFIGPLSGNASVNGLPGVGFRLRVAKKISLQAGVGFDIEFKPRTLTSAGAYEFNGN